MYQFHEKKNQRVKRFTNKNKYTNGSTKKNQYANRSMKKISFTRRNINVKVSKRDKSICNKLHEK